MPIATAICGSEPDAWFVYATVLASVYRTKHRLLQAVMEWQLDHRIHLGSQLIANLDLSPRVKSHPGKLFFFSIRAVLGVVDLLLCLCLSAL